MFRKMCANLQDIIIRVILSKMFCVTGCPTINITALLAFHCSTHCRISSYEPASRLLLRRLTLPPPTPQYPCMVFVNMTLAIQLAVWLPRVDQQVTEYSSHYYPNSWIGRCGEQAWPAKSPDHTPPWLPVYFWGPHIKETNPQQNCRELQHWLVGPLTT